MSLKNIIESFLAHVNELETKLNENEDLYEKEFQSLKILTDQVRATSQYACSAGEKPENRRKNRYKDILPYDFNRVTLHDDPDVPGSDYINASYIKGASGSIAYIAAQAPLPNTVDEFWRMAWESEVLTIVMVCNEFEAGRAKCERYWTNKNEVKQFGKIMVKLVEEREMGVDYRVRQFSITFGDMTRTIHHFHYHTWPDHGTPLSVNAMIEMVGLVRKFQANETVPVLVHCSAGCGRTGTVCAIDYIGGLLRLGKLTEGFSIKQLVFEMRKQRIAMVQTAEQYMVVHRAVRELFEEHLKVIDSHPYANIDFTGNSYLHEKMGDYENIEKCGAVVVEKGGPVIITVSKEESSNSLHAKVPPLPKKTKSDQKNKAEWDSICKNEIDYLEANTDKMSNKSRMDYVKDWCEGILAKSSANEETSQEQVDESLTPQHQAVLTRVSTPTQSPFQSPSLKRCSTCEVVDDKHLREKSNCSNLVRKPSMAKFRALFDSPSNSGSSGTSSPENWLSRSSSRSKTLTINKPQDGRTESTVGGMLSAPKVTRSKSKSKELQYLRDKMGVNIFTRYDDTAYRIFKENRNLIGGENFDGQDVQIVVGSTPSSRSGNGDDFSLSDSPSPRIIRHRSYLSVSHSPLPTSSSESVVKDLVTRVVGSRRSSFAEKRSSTWYDDAASIEADNCDVKTESQQSIVYKKANNAHVSGRKNKHGNGSPVKRSISMKVGFRSPIFSRTKNDSDKIAAYLAVEQTPKSQSSPKAATEEKETGAKKDAVVCYTKKEEDVVTSNANIKCHVKDMTESKNEKTTKRSAPVNNISKEQVVCRTTPIPSPRLSRMQSKDQILSTVPSKLVTKIPAPAVLDTEMTVTISPPRTTGLKNSDNVCKQQVKTAVKSVANDGKRFQQPGNDEKLDLVQNSASAKAVLDKELISSVLGSLSTEKASADDSYGAEMDEYCQKIIRDCQKYLVSRQSGYLSSEGKSGDEDANVTDKPSNADSQISRVKSDHDYERLWFSHSAPMSVPNEEQYDQGIIRDGKSTFYVHDQPDYVNHAFIQHNIDRKLRETGNKSVEKYIDVLSEEGRFTKQDLENILKSGSEISDRGHRKPLPAPRTNIQATKSIDERGKISVGNKNRDDEVSSQEGFNYLICDQRLMNRSVEGSFHEYENTVLKSGCDRLQEVAKDDEISDLILSDHDAAVNVLVPITQLQNNRDPAMLYRTVHKCRSRDQDDQILPSCDNELVVMRTRAQDDAHCSRYMSKSVIVPKPVAPPRLRRKPSLSSSRSIHASNDTRPISLELERHLYFGTFDRQEIITPNQYDEQECVDSADEIPPVPIKTKDAYRLPQDDPSFTDLSSLNLESPSAPTGLHFTRALNKLHTNILSKFAHNNEDKDGDFMRTAKSSPRCLVVPEFPNRLNVKPKGPREPPCQWKVPSCTL